jgi:hypothetical protein
VGIIPSGAAADGKPYFAIQVSTGVFVQLCAKITQELCEIGTFRDFDFQATARASVDMHDRLKAALEPEEAEIQH